MEDINSHDNSITYQKLYNFVNSKDVRCNFFIFDKDMNPIIASTKKIPEYALKENMFSWGITRRMLDTPNQTVIEKQSYDIASKQILSVGKAIIKNGNISGYVTFDLHEEDISRIISRNFSVDAAITDKYTNVVSTTNKLLTNKFGKINDSFKGMPGFIKSGNDSQYMVKSQILDGNISVYTITSIGYITSIFILVGVLLIILFITLSLTMHVSAKKIADSKTRAIDDIIEGISNVQNGNLEAALNINTRDEFQIIAESYNKMLVDIKNLIEVNKEKATQNILSEIKQLESQFDPHFLFNTLEMIRCMSAMDPSSVNNVILNLSALLRYSINNNIHNVTLGEDIEYTENYLMIQKYRFGKRFNYNIEVDERAADCVVPKLIIQPIIENAIKYGFGDRMELSVDIKTGFARDNLIIEISDNGVGMAAEQLEIIQKLLAQEKNDSAYIGLFNVHRRIQLMYGNAYGLKIQIRENSGIVVSLNLPVKRSADYAESVNS